MFRVTNNGYLVECGTCGNEEMASSLRIAKNTFDFHECSTTPNKVSDYTLVMANKPIEDVTPMLTTSTY